MTFKKNKSKFTRRPIAHTCGPCLELPSTYSNFCELREEFSNILKKSTWEMDSLNSLRFIYFFIAALYSRFSRPLDFRRSLVDFV